MVTGKRKLFSGMLHLTSVLFSELLISGTWILKRFVLSIQNKKEKGSLYNFLGKVSKILDH